MNFGKLRILISQFLQKKRSTLPTTLTCRFSRNSGETTTRMRSWRQNLTAYLQTQGRCFMAMAWWDATRAEAMICQFTSRYIRLLWESDVDNRNGHAAIFEVKFGKKRCVLSRLRCCVCHLHHKWAMHSPVGLRILRNNASTSVSLQSWCHCGRCQRSSMQTQKNKNTKIYTSPQLPLRKERRNVKPTWTPIG